MSRDLTNTGNEGDDMHGLLPDLSQFGAAVEPLRPSWDADGHVDEGTVHAWLDGAFSADDAVAIDAHVATCAVCAARVAEARGLLAASARILGALDGVPAGVVPAEDAARTAARIASEVPDVVPMVPAAASKAASAPRQRAWHAQPWLRAAAVLVVAIGSGVVWSRGGDRVGDVATAADTAVPTERAVGVTEPMAAPAPSVASSTTEPAADRRADSLRERASAVADAATRGASSQPNRAADVAATPPMVAPSAPAPAPAARVAAGAAMAASARMARPDSSVSANATGVSASAAAPVVAQGFAQKASAEASALKSFIVAGMVMSQSTPRPIQYANIRVGRRVNGADAWTENAATDASGRFRVTLLNVTRADTVVVHARAIGYEPQRMVAVAAGDSVTLSLSLRASAVQLSAVTVASEAAPKVERSSVGSRAGAAAAPPAAQDFSGRGVAGGIAKGVVPAAAAATRAQPPARRRPDYGYADSSSSIAANERFRPIDREQYDRILDNPFLGARDNPLSTFSIDVDRAAFGNVRRFLTQGQRPPKDAVRIEEMINWFPYDLAEPRGNDPVAITSEVITAPWQTKHRLVRIALQSKRIATDNLPPSNLVFLIDVSGSMMDPNKLPLVKQSLRLLVDQLRPQDRVAIVTYAGAAGLVLPSTSGDEKSEILAALDRLEAGGSTAGGAGIELAYRTAREHFLDRGNNRVVLATDGDFNVGVSSDAELERLIERKRAEGTYLTVLGFGMGNYQDAKMQKLAKAGNGNYAYVDELSEARKVLVHELGATLVTVANDVKLQVEFNPSLVHAYRLIGYEDRLLRTEDFNDDKKDAGDMGAGHQVTALYEIVPVGVEGTVALRGIDSLRYATPAVTPRSVARDGELMFVKLRYKRPGESTSRLMSHPVSSRVASRGSEDTRFAAAVAGFGMLMRDSEYKGTTSVNRLLDLARSARGDDEGGYRSVLVQLIERWRAVVRARD